MAQGQHHSSLGDRYDLLEIIGSGGMGVVWRGYDRELRRQVACKILSGAFAEDAKSQERFQREARHIAALSHPNIVMVFDSGIADGRAFIVMEYIQGPSLRDILASSSTLSVGVTAALAVDALAGLAHAHNRGIIHRDVKPANLLISRDGILKVADFGISKSLEETDELTEQGSFVGTTAYAAPEQLAGNEVGARSDIYSVGCVIYRCLSGITPGDATAAEQSLHGDPGVTPIPLADLQHDVPNEVSRIVELSMAQIPTERFNSASEMRERLLPFENRDEVRWLLEESITSSTTEETEGSRPGRSPVGHGGLTSAQTAIEPKNAPTTSGHWRQMRAKKSAVLIGAGCALVVVLTMLLLTGAFGGNRGMSIGSSTLPSGSFLQPGGSIASPNGRFTVVMQTDGNLVEYSESGRVPIWESGTSGNFDSYLVMQADGDMVIYPKGKSAPPPGHPTSALWSSGTFNHQGASAMLSNTGDFTVRSAGVGRTLWIAPLISAG